MEKTRIHFSWAAVSPNLWECLFNGIKLRIERTRAGFAASINRPGRGWILDGVDYETREEAADAAECSALASLREAML